MVGLKPIRYSKDADKTLRRMQRQIALRVRDKVAAWVADPASLTQNVTELKGRPGVVRLRVGDLRALIRETETEVQVIAVGPRGGTYDE